MHARARLIIIAAMAIAGCTTQPPDIERLPETEASLPEVSAPSDVRSEIALLALAQLGVPYAMGGDSPQRGFDCSGLVAYVFQRASRVALPRTTYAQSRVGTSIGANELRPGDLVFYNTLRRANSHVGIYLGEDRFVHAPSSGGVVRIEDMRQSYWSRRFNGARRVTP